jgi:uncharacterized cupredoxin-like copper-binding protein
MRAKVALVLAAVAFVVAGGSAQAATHPEQVGLARGLALIKSVNVTATEFKFVLSTKTAKRGVVIFRIKNIGKLGHDFSIHGRKTRVISPGKSATLRVVFLRKGAYPYKCTVPGHAAAGMKGVFTIA